MMVGGLTMSHINNIGGYANAAAEYQEYLERLKAARLAESEEDARKKARLASFDTPIDSEPEPDGDPENDADPDSDCGSGDSGKSYA